MSKCPVEHDDDTPNPHIAPPGKQNDTAVRVNDNMLGPTAAVPLPGQRMPLPTSGRRSNIPKWDPDGKEGVYWEYPSEQRFYNALIKKGWKRTAVNPREEDMQPVVAIHNATNEQAWRELMRWEQMHMKQCKNPKLKKIKGKPNDRSYKSLWNEQVWGYKKPYDRHDWTIDRCGQEVEYIIDFYEGKSNKLMGPYRGASYLDVRPKLTIGGAWDRLKDYLGFAPPSVANRKDKI